MTQSLSPGDFYLYCPALSRGGGLFGSLGRTISLGFSKSCEKSTHERIYTLLKQSNKNRPPADNKHLVDLDSALCASSWNASPSSWHLGGGAALIVNHGLFEVAGGHVHRVQPCVYYDEDSAVICVFQGYLSNLDEICERYCEVTASPFDSPTSVAAKDPREAAAHAIYRMYIREDPLILLSELQGQYAFCLYDGDKKQIFAARDSSGKEPLFMEICDDGAVSVSNSQITVPAPDGIGFTVWSELPPGHYAYGKSTLKIKQFALTPAQLSAREYYDTLEDELSPRAASSGRRSLSDEFNNMGMADYYY